MPGSFKRLFVKKVQSEGAKTSSNRCISDFAIATSKFLALLGTSDMPETLSEISAVAFKYKRR